MVPATKADFQNAKDILTTSTQETLQHGSMLVASKCRFINLLVVGPYGSGVTTFVNRLLYDNTFMSTWEFFPDSRGQLRLAEDLVLNIFSVPGQRRFDFMWEIMMEAAMGLIVLVDSTKPETFHEAQVILETLRSYTHIPTILSLNKQDLPDAFRIEDIRAAFPSAADIKFMECIAHDFSSAVAVLVALLQLRQQTE
jgi:small GTP-binding protein